MSGFLYYIPGVPDNHDPREGKLAYAFDDRPMGRRCFKGPDGTEGIVFGADGGGAVGYHPERQTWQEFKYLGCWIGYYKDDPPKEGDLQRKKILSGSFLEIKRQQWQIPIARSFQDIDGQCSGVCALSTYVSINPDTGDFVNGKLREEYQPLWDAAMRYWDIWWHANIGDVEEAELTEITEIREVEIEPNELEKLTFVALSTNYRVGRAEAHLIELLSTEDCFAILGTITDLDSFNEIVKKKLSQLENSDTDSGQPAKADPMPQPLLIG